MDLGRMGVFLFIDTLDQRQLIDAWGKGAFCPFVGFLVLGFTFPGK
jgi:hypothetical protein